MCVLRFPLAYCFVVVLAVAAVLFADSTPCACPRLSSCLSFLPPKHSISPPALIVSAAFVFSFLFVSFFLLFVRVARPRTHPTSNPQHPSRWRARALPQNKDPKRFKDGKQNKHVCFDCLSTSQQQQQRNHHQQQNQIHTKPKRSSGLHPAQFPRIHTFFSIDKQQQSRELPVNKRALCIHMHLRTTSLLACWLACSVVCFCSCAEKHAHTRARTQSSPVFSSLRCCRKLTMTDHTHSCQQASPISESLLLGTVVLCSHPHPLLSRSMLHPPPSSQEV